MTEPKTPYDALRKELLGLLKLYPTGASTGELARETGKPRGVVTASLNLLRKRGRVESEMIQPKIGPAYAVWRLPEWEP